MKKVVVVLSGGLDSTVLAYQAVKDLGAENVAAITFDYGQRHNKEIMQAKLSTSKLVIKPDSYKHLTLPTIYSV